MTILSKSTIHFLNHLWVSKGFEKYVALPRQIYITSKDGDKTCYIFVTWTNQTLLHMASQHC